MAVVCHKIDPLKIQICDTNYSYYKKIFEIFQLHIGKLYPPEILEAADGVKILNSMESESKTLAKRGLKAALQNLISNSLPSLNVLREA